MGDNITKEYADNLIASIRANCDAGNPFGESEPEGLTHDDCRDDVTVSEGVITCAECGVLDDFADVEGLPTAWDYASEALDFRYIIGRDGGYLGAEIAITLGGPNVWIHTREEELRVHWAFHSETRSLPSEFCNGLDAALEEYYGSTR